MATARLARRFLGLGLQLEVNVNRQGKMKMRVSVTRTFMVTGGCLDRLPCACMAQIPKLRWRVR
jgi:hypothetical protein